MTKTRTRLLTLLLCLPLVLAAATAHAADDDDATTALLGYCPADLNGADALGLGDGELRIAAAIHLPRTTMMRHQGMAITHLRFAVRSGLTDASVWIRSSLTTSSLVVQSVGQLSDGWNEVELRQPLTIDGSELYIGYTATQPAGYSGILAAGTGNEHTSWLAVDNQWADYHADGLGILFIQAVAQGHRLQRGATVVSLQADQELYAPGATMTVRGELANLGDSDLSGSDVVVDIDGHQVATLPLSATLQPDAVVPFELSVALPALDEGAHRLTARASSATIDEEAAHATFYTYATAYPRTLLLEHFTSLPCVNCPPVDRLLDEVVGQRTDVVWVSHHVGYKDDEFTLSGSLPLLRFGINGNPYIMLDRATLDGEQPPFTIGGYSHDFVGTIFDYAAQRPALLQLHAAAQAAGQGHLHISIDGEGKAFITDYMPRATLHVYLVEDSVEAEGVQAGDATKRHHNNILRAIVTPARGVLPQWQAGEGKQHFTADFTADLDSRWLSDRLRVVAFLAAPTPAGTTYPTGAVLNSVQAHPDSPAAISTVSADSADSGWLTPDGRRVATPKRGGLYIRNGKKIIYQKP